VVHDEPKSSKQTVEALRLVRYEVAAFIDPMAALDALENAQRVEVLITRVRFRKTQRDRPGSDGSA
jgi:PleD family two-component response regulator